MSNIIVNMRLSDDAAPKRLGNKKKNKKRFHKTPSLDQKGYVEGKHKNNHKVGCARHDQTARQSGACLEHPASSTPTQSESLQHPDSALHCGSLPSPTTHRLSSWTPLTADGKKIHKKPKEPVNTKSLSTTLNPTGPTTSTAAIPTKYLALDCEMVGAGPKGHINQLARCSIVSYEGDVIYDKFINPAMPVTDYRTRWSGIRRSDLIKATPYSEARKEILRLLMGKVVIGHAIHNDFKVLGYSHPAALTRDTSRIPLLNLKAGFAENECASLKRLTKAIFNRNIQTGKKGHSSVEDARATMELYKVVEEEWERRLASTSQGR